VGGREIPLMTDRIVELSRRALKVPIAPSWRRLTLVSFDFVSYVHTRVALEREQVDIGDVVAIELLRL
jgi:hypothetical protein